MSNKRNNASRKKTLKKRGMDALRKVKAMKETKKNDPLDLLVNYLERAGATVTIHDD